MRNRYDFNIEDVKQVIICTIEDPCKYTIICERKYIDNGKPTRQFVERYQAEYDTVTQEGCIGIICPRCGAWNFYDKNESNIDELLNINNCHKCDDSYEVTYSEDDLINLVMDFMDEESFYGVNIFINGIPIE